MIHKMSMHNKQRAILFLIILTSIVLGYFLCGIKIYGGIVKDVKGIYGI